MASVGIDSHDAFKLAILKRTEKYHSPNIFLITYKPQKRLNSLIRIVWRNKKHKCTFN